MYKLILIATLGTLLYLGYEQYDTLRQQQLNQEQARQKYQQEKEALDLARATNKLTPLNQFIQQNPESDWLETAVYYRDRLVMQIAVDSGNTETLAQFILNNPNSEWKNHARQQLKKLKREQEIEKSRQLAIIKKQNEELSKRKRSTVNSKKTIHSGQSKKSKRDDSAERVQRALSIYQKINKQKQRDASQEKKQQQRNAEFSRRCNKLKDELKQFKMRTRWYQLDEKGNRVFIDKATVAKRKKDMQADYDRYCQ